VLGDSAGIELPVNTLFLRGKLVHAAWQTGRQKTTSQSMTLAHRSVRCNERRPATAKLTETDREERSVPRCGKFPRRGT
jgi:hypothetical protein